MIADNKLKRWQVWDEYSIRNMHYRKQTVKAFTAREAAEKYVDMFEKATNSRDIAFGTNDMLVFVQPYGVADEDPKQRFIVCGISKPKYKAREDK